MSLNPNNILFKALFSRKLNDSIMDKDVILLTETLNQEHDIIVKEEEIALIIDELYIAHTTNLKEDDLKWAE